MAVIIIPARFASSRFPGKPLVQLRDKSGASKPLIQRSWESANEVRGVDAVYVATDDDRIADCARSFGADVVMTSETARNGTERCAEAAMTLRIDTDLIINFQGDAPLTPPWFVEALVGAMSGNGGAGMATPVLRCDLQTYDNFVEDRRNGRVGGTTAVFDREGRALYFSKEVLPYAGDAPTSDQEVPVFHHVGVYAYKPSALADYAQWPEGKLERREGLEQLRFLENAETVLCVKVEARGRAFWELNNPIDVGRIEAVL